jgi:hypothetical protein
MNGAACSGGKEMPLDEPFDLSASLIGTMAVFVSRSPFGADESA